MPSSPAGWDSLNKISLLEQNLTKYRSGEDFEKVVPKPAEEVKTTNKEPTLTAVDDQVRGLLEGGFVNSAHVIYANGTAFGGGPTEQIRVVPSFIVVLSLAAHLKSIWFSLSISNS